MDQYQSTSKSDTGNHRNQPLARNEAEDRPVRTERKKDSIFSTCWRGLINLVLNFWLIFLFAVATLSVVGCLSAHVFQSRFNHVLYNRTVNEKEHTFLQYLKLRKALTHVGM